MIFPLIFSFAHYILTLDASCVSLQMGWNIIVKLIFLFCFNFADGCCGKHNSLVIFFIFFCVAADSKLKAQQAVSNALLSLSCAFSIRVQMILKAVKSCIKELCIMSTTYKINWNSCHELKLVSFDSAEFRTFWKLCKLCMVIFQKLFYLCKKVVDDIGEH